MSIRDAEDGAVEPVKLSDFAISESISANKGASSRLRVLHFFKVYFPESIGGVEQVIYQLCESGRDFGIESEVLALSQCHQPKLQPCPRQAPRSSQPPWPSGDDQASAAQSGGLAGLAVM